MRAAKDYSRSTTSKNSWGLVGGGDEDHLRVGCVDVSQAIGHYYSCTESVVKLAHRAGMPLAGDHLFTATLYIMQSRPVKLKSPEEPTMQLDEILRRLLRKTGFSSYHYMILANGLINQREFLGEDHYLHGLAGLEKMLPRLPGGMSYEYLHGFTRDTRVDDVGVDALKTRIWGGDKAGAFTALVKLYGEEGATPELMNAILHSYTRIDAPPHDPHYVTVPRSLFELVRHLNEEDVVLALAHSVEFAVDRINSRGAMTSLK